MTSAKATQQLPPRVTQIGHEGPWTNSNPRRAARHRVDARGAARRHECRERRDEQQHAGDARRPSRDRSGSRRRGTTRSFASARTPRRAPSAMPTTAVPSAERTTEPTTVLCPAPSAMRSPISFGALRDRVAQRAVEADGREHEREHGERAHQRELHVAIRELRVEHLAHRTNIRHRLGRIDIPDRSPHGRTRARADRRPCARRGWFGHMNCIGGLVERHVELRARRHVQARCRMSPTTPTTVIQPVGAGAEREALRRAVPRPANDVCAIVSLMTATVAQRACRARR